MTPFEAVLFDLDGTLCRRTQDTQRLYARTFERAGERPFGTPDALWAALDGPPDHDDIIGYYGAGFARLAAQHGRSDADPIALARALRSHVDNAAVELHPGAERAITSAGANGRLGLVTNGPETQQSEKLDALGIADRFDVLVFAADLPRSKPHRVPFETALDPLAIAPERALYVGNSLGYDVAGAQNAGMPVAWLRGDDDVGGYDPEYTIESLAELPAILDGER